MPDSNAFRDQAFKDRHVKILSYEELNRRLEVWETRLLEWRAARDDASRSGDEDAYILYAAGVDVAHRYAVRLEREMRRRVGWTDLGGVRS